MKEDVIIIHGFKAQGESVWIPKITSLLEGKGHKVFHPTFPNPDQPQLNEWLTTAKNLISQTQNDLILIGHSLGGATILHLLEGKISKLKQAYIFGSPAFSRSHASNFYDPPLNWEKIRTNSAKLTAIWSMDDQQVGEEHIQLIQKKTDAEIVILDGYGHFRGKENDWLAERLTQPN